MKYKRITGLLGLVSFTVFALCILGVLLAGAGGYRRLIKSGESQFEKRTVLQYIATRVRQSETAAVEDFGGKDCLAFRETIGGKVYVTRVYCHEGWLRELFCAEDAAFLPEDGEKILETEDLSFSLEEGCLTVTAGGQTLDLLLRSGREAPP